MWLKSSVFMGLKQRDNRTIDKAPQLSCRKK